MPTYKERQTIKEPRCELCTHKTRKTKTRNDRDHGYIFGCELDQSLKVDEMFGYCEDDFNRTENA